MVCECVCVCVIRLLVLALHFLVRFKPLGEAKQIEISEIIAVGYIKNYVL